MQKIILVFEGDPKEFDYYQSNCALYSVPGVKFIQNNERYEVNEIVIDGIDETIQANAMRAEGESEKDKQTVTFYLKKCK